VHVNRTIDLIKALFLAASNACATATLSSVTPSQEAQFLMDFFVPVTITGTGGGGGGGGASEDNIGVVGVVIK